MRNSVRSNETVKLERSAVVHKTHRDGRMQQAVSKVILAKKAVDAFY